jgi:hypothetical protein
MSLNQKYTWSDFLKEHPEFREKKIKRTSPEGKKAFEAAFKAKMKVFLKERLALIEKESKRVEKKKAELLNKAKASKKPCIRRRIQEKIGALDSYMARLARQESRTKTLQKGF